MLICSAISGWLTLGTVTSASRWQMLKRLQVLTQNHHLSRSPWSLYSLMNHGGPSRCKQNP